MASPMNWRVTSNFLRKYIVRNVNIAKHKSTNKKYHPPRPRRPLTLHLTEQLPEDLSRFEDIKTDRKESAKKEERILSVNIGLSRERNVLSNRKAFRKWTKTHKSLEPVARFKKLKLDLAEVKDAWHQEYGQSHMYRVACHYGIFRDLFGHAYFMPRIPMNIFYDYDDELVTPVYTGNKILPSEATVRPHVIYESDPDSLWTLILTSPDSHPLDNAVETLHWFIGNIKGSDVDSGDMIREYLQPFPVKGTGFHRYVFILYKQEHRIEYDPETVNLKTAGSDLEGRTFHTLEFYRKFQEQLTPASFRFFQSEWDDSVTDVFWNILNLKEPCYEFWHPPPYHPEQKRYPHEEPFNLYLDRYRDTKEIQEEVLRAKLQRTSPFREPLQRPSYPSSFLISNRVPQWLKFKWQTRRLAKQQWKDYYD